MKTILIIVALAVFAACVTGQTSAPLTSDPIVAAGDITRCFPGRRGLICRLTIRSDGGDPVAAARLQVVLNRRADRAAARAQRLADKRARQDARQARMEARLQTLEDFAIDLESRIQALAVKIQDFAANKVVVPVSPIAG